VEVIRTIESLPSGVSETDFINAVDGAVTRAVPESYGAPESIRRIETAVLDAYHFYRIEDKSVFAARTAPSGFRLTGADNITIDFIRELDGFYFSGFVSNDAFRDPLLQFFRDQYLENGAAIFGRGGSEALDRFRSLVGKTIDELSGRQVQRIVDTSVQRMRNWAQVAQMHQAKIQSIKIVELGTAVDELCRVMNGKVISVGASYGAIQKFSKMTADQFESEFYKNGDAADFAADPSGYIDKHGLDGIAAQGRGMPPYHPYCHGTIVYFS